jgi:hypothetical protein
METLNFGDGWIGLQCVADLFICATFFIFFLSFFPSLLPILLVVDCHSHLEIARCVEGATLLRLRFGVPVACINVCVLPQSCVVMHSKRAKVRHKWANVSKSLTLCQKTIIYFTVYLL